MPRGFVTLFHNRMVLRPNCAKANVPAAVDKTVTHDHAKNPQTFKGRTTTALDTGDESLGVASYLWTLDTCIPRG